VSGDLKAVFGQTKDGGAEGEEETNWDRAEEEEERGKEEEELPSSLLPDDPSTKEEESSGFKFSFFGDDVDAGSGETSELHQICIPDVQTEDFKLSKSSCFS